VESITFEIRANTRRKEVPPNQLAAPPSGGHFWRNFQLITIGTSSTFGSAKTPNKSKDLAKIPTLEKSSRP